MIPLLNSDHLIDRRKFLNIGARGMGAMGLASLAQPGMLNAAGRGAMGEPHFKPKACLLYTSPSPRDVEESRMPSSA